MTGDPQQNAPYAVARRRWRWHLDHHLGARNQLPDFCHLCWNGEAYGQPWREIGFVAPGIAA